jgi:hypothetical protein
MPVERAALALLLRPYTVLSHRLQLSQPLLWRSRLLDLLWLVPLATGAYAAVAGWEPLDQSTKAPPGHYTAGGVLLGALAATAYFAWILVPRARHRLGTMALSQLFGAAVLAWIGMQLLIIPQCTYDAILTQRLAPNSPGLWKTAAWESCWRRQLGCLFFVLLGLSLDLWASWRWRRPSLPVKRRLARSGLAKAAHHGLLYRPETWAVRPWGFIARAAGVSLLVCGGLWFWDVSGSAVGAYTILANWMLAMWACRYWTRMSRLWPLTDQNWWTLFRYAAGVALTVAVGSLPLALFAWVNTFAESRPQDTLRLWVMLGPVLPCWMAAWQALGVQALGAMGRRHIIGPPLAVACIGSFLAGVALVFAYVASGLQSGGSHLLAAALCVLFVLGFIGVAAGLAVQVGRHAARPFAR